jgi:Ca2+-transporting ATPase
MTMAMKSQNISEKAATAKKSTPLQPAMSAEELLGLPTDELLHRLETSLNGLTSQEAERRLEVYGRNELARRKKRTAVVEFLLNFRSPLIIILLVAGAISGVLGQIPNMIIIFVIVLLSVILDYYQ